MYEYLNGDYKVQIFSDGTKIRQQLTDNPRPPVLPEQMDLKITNWCDAGCGWCHENSTTSGVHADLEKTFELLKCLNPGTEIAIGGGDPLSHPGLEQFVKNLRSIGIVPSVTVNGRHFERSRPLLEKLIEQDAIFGVGISYFNEIPNWDYEHKVLHVIAGINHPSILDNVAKQKVLILGYKEFGRGQKMIQVHDAFIRENISAWYRLLPFIAKEHHLSFDNLAIDQLKPSRLFKDAKTYEQRYMGKEGLFSMYVDAVKQEFALCSYAPERFTWSIMPAMFGQVRTLGT